MNAPARRTGPGRLIGTLSGFGAISGLLIVAAFQWAQPRILAYKAAVLAAANQDVLGNPSRTETLYLAGDALSAQPPAGDTTTLERVYAGYDATGRRVGYAILAAAPGFADVISVIYGYDPGSDRVIGMKVLEHKETPGLGDRIVNDSVFVARFRGVKAPLRGVKRGAGKGGPDEVDLITGATISSRTVVNIMNRSIERIAPALRAFERGGTP